MKETNINVYIAKKVFYSQQVKGIIPIINSGSGLVVKSNVAIVGISG
jgi:hypothetical protein